MADTPPGSDEEEQSAFGEALGLVTGALGLGGAAGPEREGAGEEDENTPETENSPTPSDDEEEEDGEGKHPEEEDETPPSPAAATPAPKPKKERKPRELAIPKTSAAWFKARRKFPEKFVFTPEGDLQIPEMRGKPASVLKLPWYREATHEEKTLALEESGLQIVSLEAETDELMKQLKDAMALWRETGAVMDVLRIQKELRILDAKRSNFSHPLRWTYIVKGLTTADIQPGEGGVSKSLHASVALMRLRDLPYEKLIRAETKDPRAAAAAAERPPEETPSTAGSDDEEEEEEHETFIFFHDPADEEHGLFSPDTMVEFVFNETKYTSIRQAYEVERVTAIGRKDARPLLLRTRAPKQVLARSTLIKGDVENPKELWTNILKAVTAQQPRYQEALRGTGPEMLVYANPMDEQYGIGLSADDPDAMDKRKWKGPNMLGQAWMAVRSELPAEDEEGAEAAGGAVLKGGGAKPMFTSHGISEREAEQRRGVLMARYKRPGQ